jgi:hypothetical protein
MAKHSEKVLLGLLDLEGGTDSLPRSITEETTILHCVKLQKRADLFYTSAET